MMHGFIIHSDCSGAADVCGAVRARTCVRACVRVCVCVCVCMHVKTSTLSSKNTGKGWVKIQTQNVTNMYNFPKIAHFFQIIKDVIRRYAFD